MSDCTKSKPLNIFQFVIFLKNIFVSGGVHGDDDVHDDGDAHDDDHGGDHGDDRDGDHDDDHGDDRDGDHDGDGGRDHGGGDVHDDDEILLQEGLAETWLSNRIVQTKPDGKTIFIGMVEDSILDNVECSMSVVLKLWPVIYVSTVLLKSIHDIFPIVKN
ncbi:hypothetical protein CEXT_200681 [Caerostris extrusa]|uniref:Uncharacterized protein n=1 Tax=Caerostris extrusa TaxID=172846 RepID=A0AAV4XFI4_CAEEX|nr:hypothetical protein CEXT_200681 [Caerostris extrusa]